jgi:hypothetical protein
MSSSEAESYAVLFIEGLLSVLLPKVNYSEPQIKAFRLDYTHSYHMLACLRNNVIKDHLLVLVTWDFSHHTSIYFIITKRWNVLTKDSWNLLAFSIVLLNTTHEHLIWSNSLIIVNAHKRLVLWLSIVFWIKLIYLSQWLLRCSKHWLQSIDSRQSCLVDIVSFSDLL